MGTAGAAAALCCEPSVLRHVGSPDQHAGTAGVVLGRQCCWRLEGSAVEHTASYGHLRLWLHGKHISLDEQPVLVPHRAPLAVHTVDRVTKGMTCLQGKLRIGLAEQTVLVALGHAVLLQRDQAPSEADQLAGALEEAAQTVKYVYSQCPSYDQMVPALLEHPIAVCHS